MGSVLRGCVCARGERVCLRGRDGGARSIISHRPNVWNVTYADGYMVARRGFVTNPSMLDFDCTFLRRPQAS